MDLNTNDNQYRRRIEQMRHLPIEDQLAEAIVIIGERAASQSASSSLAIYETVHKEIVNLQDEFERVMLLAHEIANSAAAMYSNIDLMQREGSQHSREQIEQIHKQLSLMHTSGSEWGRERAMEGFPRLAKVEKAVEELRTEMLIASQQREQLRTWMQAAFVVGLVTLIVLITRILYTSGVIS